MTTRSHDWHTCLDEREIHRVLVLYCRAIDRCDAALLRRVYHPDAIDRHGPFEGNVDAIIETILPALKSKYIATTHNLTNVLIELDGETARSEAYVHASHLMLRDGVLHNWIFAGRYLDDFVRTGHGWRIAARLTVCDWEYLLRTDGHMLAPDVFPRGAASKEDPVYR